MGRCLRRYPWSVLLVVVVVTDSWGNGDVECL